MKQKTSRPTSLQRTYSTRGIIAVLAVVVCSLAWSGPRWMDDAGAQVVPDTTRAHPAAGPLEPAYLNKIQSRLGLHLIAAMSEKPNGEGNLIVSPASVAAVLALLDLGANGQMRAAMLKALAFQDEAGASGASTFAALRASMKLAQADAGGPVASANAMVFDPAAAPYPDTIAAFAASGAEVTIARLDDPATIARINNWVRRHTRDLIHSIIDRAPPEPGLVVLNALHFKDRWKRAFDPALTKPAPFQGRTGTVVEVPMMQMDGSFRLRQDGVFVAVELPYAAERFRLVLVTTRGEPARAAQFQEVADWLTGDEFEQHPGEILLPRFSVGGSADLLDALDALGLKQGRSAPGALAGLSRVALNIAQVLQRTEIRVDEAGTEAAAATAVTTTRAITSDFVKMTFDRPFLFALRDTASGVVLLTGYVASPR
jgi:serpin B